MRWLFGKNVKGADACPLYQAVVGETRRIEWYRDAGLPDTLDGRFAVLTTLLALVDQRLGAGGERSRAVAPRLTELFVADMDAQMREAGFGDPSIGKQVKKMVGALAARTERMGGFTPADAGWSDAANASLYPDTDVSSELVQRGHDLLAQWFRRLEDTGEEDVVRGKIA